MSLSEDLINQVDAKMLKDVIGFGNIGYEKESVRSINHNITKSFHPKLLGSKLCNKYITTDFAEAQLELITPPVDNQLFGISFLEDLHHFVSKNLDQQEIIWPFSMPPLFNSESDINIANFGSSNLGLFKELYRLGLSNRYGRTMQSISGIHFNYSLNSEILESQIFKDKDTLPSGVNSDRYFGMLRNIYRINWIILYLFGASPIVNRNLIQKDFSSFVKLDNETYYLPHATSLRMSNLGYHNSNRLNLSPSLNNLSDYISDLSLATKTNNKDFESINNDCQLNSNILQIDDEYYAIARPKSDLEGDDKLTSKLKRGGVSYIELRSLDLNPFSRVGIDINTAYFIEVFMILCFLRPSKNLSKKDLGIIRENDLLVAKEGRKPNLFLKKGQNKIALKEWGKQIIESMLPIAEMLDTNQSVYTHAINQAKEKIENPSLTLSGLLLDRVQKGSTSFLELGSSIGSDNKKHYLSISKKQNKNWLFFKKEADRSLNQQRIMESDNEESFAKFKSKYFEK